MTNKDYYKILEVPKSASQEEIKKTYRRLAMQYHPDHHPPEKKEWATEKFKEINEAFSVLGDPEKRRKYDQFGTIGDIGDIFTSSSTKGTFEDLIKDFGSEGLGFDFLGNIFGEKLRGTTFERFFSSGPGKVRFRTWRGGKAENVFSQAQKRQFQNVHYELAITPQEAKSGTKKILVRREKKLEVKIPSGVETGSMVKLRNARQITDGQPGDILIQIRIK